MRRNKTIALLMTAGFMLTGLNCGDDGLSRVTSRIKIELVKPNDPKGGVDLDSNAIHLAEVAIYSSETALFRIENPATKVLKISDIAIKDVQGTGKFEVASYPREVLADIDRIEDVYVVVKYAPQDEWTDPNENGTPDPEEMDKVTFTIFSDANTPEVDITVDGWGVYRGAPDIEVCFGSYCGPTLVDCASGVCTTQVLEFGNIGLGSVGTQTVTIKNLADCPRPDEGTVCDYPEVCRLTIDENERYYNMGLGFEAGTNDLGRFVPLGSIGTPVTIAQEPYGANACGEDSYIRLRINYNAPTDAADDSAVFIIESNDPETPVVKIPMSANARNAPVAMCTFRLADPGNPTAPYTDPDHIEPLDRVHFDGSGSYDPQFPDDPSRITTYNWEVISFPPGTNPADFQSNQNDPYFDFWLPLAGFYSVKLTVTNSEGITSGDTQDSICEFEVVPGSRLHTQLVWDDPVNDQDLHVMYIDQSNLVCAEPWDCYYANRSPVWFDTYPEGEGPNPRLDVDDTNGQGPENINIDEPEPGTYRIHAHYYADHNTGSDTPTRDTIRVYLNGLQVGEYRRTLTLSGQHLWAVADITWIDDTSNFVTPLTSDAEGEVGWLCLISGCGFGDGHVCEYGH